MKKSAAEEEEITINSEVKDTMKVIANTYLKSLIQFINGYFVNGNNPSKCDTKLPEWIPLSRDAFQFTATADESVRQESFSKLITTLVQPFTEGEITVAR